MLMEKYKGRVITTIISKLFYKTLILCGGIVENTLENLTKKPLKFNSDTLFKILSLNSNCEYGKKYKFSSIKSITDYKSLVPLTNYKDYEDYINRMAEGEDNILISYNVEYYGHTSGTTGKQKLIPVTKKGMLAASKYMALLIPKLSYNNFKNNYSYGRGLLLSDIVVTTYTKGGTPICSATSGGMNSIKYILPIMYTSPLEIMKINDKESAQYLHLLFALKETNLMYISAVFISHILDMLRYLDENSESLINDIRKGRITHNLKIDSATRNTLNKQLKPDASRADFLSREFKKGAKGICQRIWPKLAYIVTVTGANFSIYDEKVNYYTDYLPIYSTAYAATEGMIGINPYASKISYVIIPDTVFYEFIPVSDCLKNNPKTYNIDELSIDQSYEIVLTNYAGLYRYRLGDVVKVVGFYNNCPKIEFLYRRNQLLNMVSEKTTEEHLTSTISNTISKLKLNLVDYTTCADNSLSPGRYIFYLELNDPISPRLSASIEDVLDNELQKCNLAYGRFRRNHKLSKAKVVLLAPKTFLAIKETLFAAGTSNSQVKIPRVITSNEKIKAIINKNTLS